MGINRLKIASAYIKVFNIVFGILFLVIGLLFFFKFDPAVYDKTATASITGIDEYYDMVGGENTLCHDVYVSYAADGVTYKDVILGSYHSGMKVGDSVEILYMSEDPSQITTGNPSFVPYFGLGAAIIGAGSIIVTIIRTIKRKPF